MRTRHVIRGSWVAAAALLVVLGCSGSGGSISANEQNAQNALGDDGGGGGTFGASPTSCTANPTSQGCNCPSPGQTASCWTGPASERNVGACHDGTTQCISHGEFMQWGPCEGENLNCGSGVGGGGSEGSGGAGTGGSGTEDAGGTGIGGGGTEDGGGVGTGGGGGESSSGAGGGGSEPGSLCIGCACSNPTCTCVPGATITCDDDCSANLFCVVDAVQECLPNGTWGPCHETGTIQSFACVHLDGNCGYCNSGGGQYVGSCDGIVSCQ